jgi:hypothetical protein
LQEGVSFSKEDGSFKAILRIKSSLYNPGTIPSVPNP